ncbi:MAG: xanthine dehydrogenase YagS FAD-binding subunit [Phycisphaerales bacterium]|jgi:xanthine dehydrogenase YagS FAD-binding subunit|nr:xanthine dehydrogenase YagS FAD-binding subunit [Phycisphaerales bacterium]
MNSFEWANATSVAEAQTLREEGTVFKAGGVDLLDLMKERIATPKRVVNIREMTGFDHITPGDDGSLKLGPMVTLSRIEQDKFIRERFTALADACGHAATPQIRNMATVGGNLLQRPRCWYFRSEQFPCRKKGGEICFAQQGENQYHAIFNNGVCAIVHPSAAAVALVALGATIELTGDKGAKREMKLEEFFILPNVDVTRENKLQPGEILTEIRIPALPKGARSAYIKQGEKESMDWPVAEAAAVLEMDGDKCKSASIVLGAASPVPRRAKEAQTALKGESVTVELARAAAEATLADASPMTNNGYKIPLFTTIISRTILAAAGVKA